MQVEVSPVKVMEYMALGLPVVCFDLPESRPLGEGAGVFVEPGDVDALAASVVALLDDDVERERLGVEGRRRITEELAWERQTAVYRRAVVGRSN